MNKSQLIFLIAFLITGCDDEVIKPSCLTAVEKGRFIDVFSNGKNAIKIIS